jgi:hypothetical protein
MMHEPLPPPPPFKDAGRSARPITPRVGLPATPRNGKTAASSVPRDADDTSSSATLTNASPPRREIWRRRASSKSDRSIAVAGLKLAVSHGSTAATTVPLPPSEMESSQNLPAEPVMSNPRLDASANRPAPLPPRSTSALPGRNIRPQPQQGNAGSGIVTTDKRDELGNVKGMTPSPANSGHTKNQSPQPLTKDSPTLKTEPTDFSTVSQNPENGNGTIAPDAVPSLPSPEPPVKSIKRREVGTKPSLQSMRGKEPDPAQHLREARSAIDLKASRIERAQWDATQESLPLEQPQFYEDHYGGGVPSPRARRPSNTSQRRLAAAPQLMVTSPTARAGPSEPVEYKDQEPLRLTPQEEKNLVDVINRVVNRSREWSTAVPNKQGVWPCKELSGDHINCLSNHKRWLPMGNSNNPIACMLCHDGNPQPRRVCRTCGIRVCPSCAELLNGRKIEELDFEALVNKDKGKEADVAEA